jgi:citrate synthase
LGVKLATLYAYVSRGVLTSYGVPGDRRRVFRREDVEQLAARARQGKEVETRLATVVTSITHMGEDATTYRGESIRALAGTRSFEEVAELLWDGAGPGGRWAAAELSGVPCGLSDPDRLRWAAVMAGASDPFRRDLRAESVRAAGRRVIATMVEALPVRCPRRVPALVVAGHRWPGSVAQGLTARLSPAPASGSVVVAVNRALVVLADHELASSTLAARVAASTRTDLYGAVLAGLGVMSGPLHGAASGDARRLLEDAEQRGPERAVADALAAVRAGTESRQVSVPGFGHTVYRRRDPRTPILLEAAEALATEGQRQTLAGVRAVAAERGLPLVNVDLAVGALGWAGRLTADAGEVIATVARVAGWTAHVIEELAEPPLRFRARAVYARPPG